VAARLVLAVRPDTIFLSGMVPSIRCSAVRLFPLVLALASMPRAAAALSGDIEVDPFAYLVDGHSLHAGLRLPHQRIDLGSFAADAPKLLHRNEGFDSYISGVGLKYDLCLREDCNGFFAGIEGSAIHNFVTLESTDQIEGRRQFTAGIRGGYRWDFHGDGRGLFVVPWVGLSYNWYSRSITIDGQHFEDRRLSVVPTIHVGYAF
jgi:hypothetical protein